SLTLQRFNERQANHCSRKTMRAFVKSYGESSTETLSSGTIRMKCLRILPEICASTLRWPERSTRNIVPGNTSVTVPSVTICSSFGIAPKYNPGEASLNRARRIAAVGNTAELDCFKQSSLTSQQRDEIDY